ncbi:Phasin [Jannaschia sp. LMIT008]|uniref:Phasin n=1 Tax=Jannaschia maritima TaxID=3032585 RepID=UPI002811D649|nr:Phasin [Jannaschia sp. LMIT008]
MNKTQDFTKYMTDMMGMMPVDTAAMSEAFKAQAAFAEKLGQIALQGAEQSAEISHKWTRETLEKMAPVATVKDDASDYAKAMTDFASAYAEVSAENMAAFAEVAKKVQMETMDVMMAAGKEAQEDASVAVKQATAQATTATKRAAVPAK